MLQQVSQSKAIYPSQHGEDRELERRFRGRVGYFLDVGAADGVLFSNTYRLERLGWTGLLIEANPEEAEACTVARPGSRVVNCAAVAPGGPPEVTFQVAVDNPGLSAVEISRLGRERLHSWTGDVRIREVTVPARTADAVLADDPPSWVDVVSIDVEGHEAAVLHGLDLERWKPAVVIVERNTRLPDRQVMRRLHTSGYVYEQTTGVNDWFVRGSVSLRYRAKLLATLYLPRIVAGVQARTVRLVRR